MPQDIINHMHAIAHHQGATASLTFANCYGVPHNPYDLDSDDDNNSSYSPSNADSNTDPNDASNVADDASDDNADPNLAAATDNIAGVADYDEIINNNVDEAGVEENANDNAKIAGVDDNHYPQDDNYYPQAFHDETADKDEPIDTKDEVIDTKQPNGDDDPVVEMVEEEEDPCNDLEWAMDEQYGTQSGT